MSVALVFGSPHPSPPKKKQPTIILAAGGTSCAAASDDELAALCGTAQTHGNMASQSHGNMAPSCPANADLRNETALEAMLAARASPARAITILILGWTHGKAQVTMRETGVGLIETQVHALRAMGIENYLIITPLLLELDKRHVSGNNNLCVHTLRPLGLCCGYSDTGLSHLSSRWMPGSPSPDWGLFPTHPYMLFIQRWWFTAMALTRGYSILSLDADLHLSTNPYHMLHAPALRHFDVIFQADGGWPVRRRPDANATTSVRDSEVRVPCGERAMRRGARSDDAAGGEHSLSVCGVTAAPSVNTGFVWARAGKASTAQLFNRTVNTIVTRMQQPQIRDHKGNIHTGQLWPQAVMNQVVFRYARLPARGAAVGGGAHVRARCHQRDSDCQTQGIPKVAGADGVFMPISWWISPPRNSSVWLASAVVPNASVAVGDGAATSTASGGDGGGTSTGRAAAPLQYNRMTASQMYVTRPWNAAADDASASDTWAWTFDETSPRSALTDTELALGDHLIAHTELDGGVQLAVLPRPLVGRLCGKRKVTIAELTRASAPDTPRAVPCEALVHERGTMLGQRVQHLQFTNAWTRSRVFAAMQWSADTARGASLASASASPQAPAGRGWHAPGWLQGSCGVTLDELVQSLPPAQQYGVVVGSAMAERSIFCMEVAPAPKRTVQCPCCWEAPAAMTKETNRCAVWNPNL